MKPLKNTETSGLWMQVAVASFAAILNKTSALPHPADNLAAKRAFRAADAFIEELDKRTAQSKQGCEHG